MSATVPTSLGYRRWSPNARPRTSPDATIAGKLRHGRNMTRGIPASAKSRRSPEPLDDRRDPLSESDARGGESVGGLSLVELVQHRGDPPRARRPQGVAKGDRPAVHVHLRGI